MKFFQKTLLPDPLGPILERARRVQELPLAEAARRAGISEAEALALEEDRTHDPGTSRLHACTYARTLGIDPEAIRESLPPPPELMHPGKNYLSNMARTREPQSSFQPELMSRILAPLGKAAVILLLLGTFFSTWGMMRRLSRVRSIPWVTSNARPASFDDR